MFTFKIKYSQFTICTIFTFQFAWRPTLSVSCYMSAWECLLCAGFFNDHLLKIEVFIVAFVHIVMVRFIKTSHYAVNDADQ